jgi:pimeloyl-ACP methyl ester carboxylesterase
MIVFKDEASRARILAWHGRFRSALPVATESREVSTSSGPAHVLVAGPAEAPSLVVLHGAMASSAHVLGELGPLLGRVRAYAVDVVGQSVKGADTRLSVASDDYGRWLAEVLDGLGLARANVLGVSWGGFVATRLAVVAPERVERLVLFVPAGIVKTPAWTGLTKMGLPMARYMAFPTPRNLERFLSGLLTTMDDDWAPYLADAFRSYRMDMKVPKLATTDELARFLAPVLVVGADEDASFPGEALLARARALFPGPVETELVRGSKHSPPTTDAFRRWTADRLARFLGVSPSVPEAA